MPLSFYSALIRPDPARSSARALAQPIRGVGPLLSVSFFRQSVGLKQKFPRAAGRRWEAATADPHHERALSVEEVVTDFRDDALNDVAEVLQSPADEENPHSRGRGHDLDEIRVSNKWPDRLGQLLAPSAMPATDPTRLQ